MAGEKLYMYFGFWEECFKRREIKRKLEEAIKILQEHKTSLMNHSYQSHWTNSTYQRSLHFNTLEDGAESGMERELCLGFQPGVLNANDS